MVIILFILVISYFKTSTSIEISGTSIEISNDTLVVQCPYFGLIENGNVTVIEGAFGLFSKQLNVDCRDGFDIVGPSRIACSDGHWEFSVRPQCVARCKPPPSLKYGSFNIEGEKDEHGMFKKGTLATYSCEDSYELVPADSIYRVCERGIWTGAKASCVLVRNVTNCRSPKGINHGYYVSEKMDKGIAGRLQVRYFCNLGYELIGGSAVKICMADGSWNPSSTPICSLIKSDTLDEYCPLPNVAHAKISGIQRIESSESGSLVTGAEIEINCEPNYRNHLAPCQSARLQCLGGKWIGNFPKCVYVKDCLPPPLVPHATPYDPSFLFSEIYESRPTKYPIDTTVNYRCLPGYEMEDAILTCSTNGCWLPADVPFCKSTKHYYLEVTGGGPILVSIVTGACVLLLLVIICLVLVCRRRKLLQVGGGGGPAGRSGGLLTITAPGAMSSSVNGGGGGTSLPRTLTASGSTADLADHATLLHHPDRLALIAFADGMQPVLPTYEEATRERLSISNRLQRPHWPSLVSRRARNSPNPDNIHVTRQGSFASHSASTRSGGDPMGSTDTMAVSENSTTVTLDTASSLSGSQPASCRAHCGSLASFDTSSVLNTEGVPLLEESELEEIQCGDTVSLAMENRSMTDNSSYKFSTASDVA